MKLLGWNLKRPKPGAPAFHFGPVFDAPSWSTSLRPPCGPSQFGTRPAESPRHASPSARSLARTP
eukprot:12333416-Heterocapsa_arctica.AAC.1